MNPFPDWRDFAGQTATKFFKATIYQGEYSTLGINCLEPGQEQQVHAHEHSDKLYFVVEGAGTFMIGDETKNCGVGEAALAPAGVQHGVRNDGDSRVSILVMIAPPISAK